MIVNSTNETLKVRIFFPSTKEVVYRSLLIEVYRGVESKVFTTLVGINKAVLFLNTNLNGNYIKQRISEGNQLSNEKRQ